MASIDGIDSNRFRTVLGRLESRVKPAPSLAVNPDPRTHAGAEMPPTPSSRPNHTSSPCRYGCPDYAEAVDFNRGLWGLTPVAMTVTSLLRREGSPEQYILRIRGPRKSGWI